MDSRNALEMGAVAREEFGRFPVDLQSRIVRHADAVGQRVLDHVVQILIGVPGGQAHPQDANHASGVVAFVQDQVLLFTAHHVLQKYRRRVAADPDVVFQVGNVPIDPDPRTVHEREDDDLVVIEMKATEQFLIPAFTWRPLAWPPRPPAVGEFVAFGGLPTEYRVNDSGGAIDLAAFGGILQVLSSTGRSFRCAMARERLVKTRGPELPPVGSRLWGMSGGPVFRMCDDGEPELTGILTDWGETFEVFMMAPLALADI